MQSAKTAFRTALIGILMIGIAGCSQNTVAAPASTQSAGVRRAEVKDVGAAIDQLATDLLTLPILGFNGRQSTIAITNVNNRTIDPSFTDQTFSQRLRPKLAELGGGRVVLIENRATPAGQNPDFGLSITVDEIPSRGAGYYLIAATLTNLTTHAKAWVSPPYESGAAQ